jgi:hypothetical protein
MLVAQVVFWKGVFEGLDGSLGFGFGLGGLVGFFEGDLLLAFLFLQLVEPHNSALVFLLWLCLLLLVAAYRFWLDFPAL